MLSVLVGDYGGNTKTGGILVSSLFGAQWFA
jgi:hypothetical protein